MARGSRLSWNRTRWVLTLLPVVALVTGCGGDEKKKDSTDAREAFAKQALGGGGEDVHSKAREAEQQELKKKFADRKAAEEAETARVQKVFDEIVVLPEGEKKPKNVVAACDLMKDQFHEFMVRVTQEDDRAAMEWWEGRLKKLGARKAKCVKIGSVEAAWCQAHALSKAPDDFKGKELEILNACITKFAPDKAQAAREEDAAAAAKVMD